MKRGLVLIGLAGAAATVLWQQFKARREQRDLWADVTDPLA